MYDPSSKYAQYEQNKLNPPVTQRPAGVVPPVTPAPLQQPQQRASTPSPAAMANQSRPMGMTGNTGPTSATVSGIPASMQQPATPRPATPPVSAVPSYAAPKPVYNPQPQPYTTQAPAVQRPYAGSVVEAIDKAVAYQNMTPNERLAKDYLRKYEEQRQTLQSQSDGMRNPLRQLPGLNVLPDSAPASSSEVPTSAFRFRSDDPRLSPDYINALPEAQRAVIARAQVREAGQPQGGAGGRVAGGSVVESIDRFLAQQNMTPNERLAKDYMDKYEQDRLQRQSNPGSRYTPEERARFDAIFNDAVAYANMTPNEKLAHDFKKSMGWGSASGQQIATQDSHFGGAPGEAQARFERAAQIRSEMPAINDSMNFNSGGALSRQKTTDELVRDYLSSDKRSDKRLGADIMLGRERNTMDRDRLNMEQQSRQSADAIAQRMSIPQVSEAESRARNSEYVNWLHEAYAKERDPEERSRLERQIAMVTGRTPQGVQLTYEQKPSNPDDPTSPMIRRPIIVDPATGESRYAEPQTGAPYADGTKIYNREGKAFIVRGGVPVPLDA